MKQTRIQNAVEQPVDYIGNFVYEDNQLKCILTDEGIALAKSNGTFEYPEMARICNPPFHLKKKYT